MAKILDGERKFKKVVCRFSVLANHGVKSSLGANRGELKLGAFKCRKSGQLQPSATIIL